MNVDFGDSSLVTLHGAQPIDIAHALPLPGWMTEAELSWLAEQAMSRVRILEIGSWCGRSTRVLGDHTPGSVYAVDQWNGAAGLDHSIEDVRKPSPEWFEFQENLKDLVGIGKVVPIRAEALNWL